MSNIEDNKLSVKELSKLSNKSAAWIYKFAKRLGRLPTLEELKNAKKGRPTKY